MVMDMRNDLYEKLQEYSHHEYEKIGVSSLVTRMTSDAFVLMQFSDQMLKAWSHYSHHDWFQVVLLILQTQSFFGLDCRCFSSFLSSGRLVCSYKKPSLCQRSNRKLWIA